MYCKICNKKSKNLENHHIIPVSRGGKNKDNNLVLLCSSCHGLAHDVSFTNERAGLIKEGNFKAKIKDETAIKWVNINEEKINKKLNNLFETDIEKYNLLISLMNCKILNAVDLMDFCVLGKFTKKITIYS